MDQKAGEAVTNRKVFSFLQPAPLSLSLLFAILAWPSVLASQGSAQRQLFGLPILTSPPLIPCLLWTWDGSQGVIVPMGVVLAICSSCITGDKS